MFFKKVTMEVYNQLYSDFFLKIPLQEQPELTYQEFAQKRDFSNKYSKTSFLDLALFDIVKSLSLALEVFIFSKIELREKF